MAKLSVGTALSEGIDILRDRFGLLAVVAGLFHVLPGMALGLWFAGFQLAAMTAPETVLAQLQGGWIGLAAAYLVALLIQFTGAGALCATAAGTRAPSLGEAIATGLRCLPTLLGCLLIAAVSMFALILLVFLAIGGGAIVGGAAGGGAGLGVMAVLVPLLLFIGLIYLAVKYALTLPAIVVDGISNPLAAFARSWRLTRGNSLRLFALFTILMIVYGVIAQVIVNLTLGQIITGGGATPGSGLLATFTLGTVLIGALVNVLLTAIVVSAHRQLAGPSTGDVAETFA